MSEPSDNVRNASRDDHVGIGLLLRAIDDELSGAETLAVESHLAVCEACRKQHLELRLASHELEILISGIRPVYSQFDREQLVEQLDLKEQSSVRRNSYDLARRFGWGMAIAATLAIGVLFLPHARNSGKSVHTNWVEPQTAFEVDGESFVALPYSNPDLPMSSSHIVQMQIPVSSLADAGIIFEPIANEVNHPDDSVLADVLVGIDGQPLGVHVLGGQ